jgi:hypothetical protein
MPNTCYMCPLAETTVEHVPPRCLFPEQKDLPPGIDLRKRLITVPSCDVHNTAKSKDDEYLLYALLLNIPNNKTAENHVFTKVQRAVERNPFLLAQFAEKQLPVFVVDRATGQGQQTVAMQVDLQRLKGSLEMIGRALYFHHFRQLWPGQVSVYPHFVLALTEPDARELNRPREQIAAAVEELVKNAPLHGNNPEVFAYQIVSQPPTLTVLCLRFYEGSRVTLLFRDSG